MPPARGHSRTPRLLLLSLLLLALAATLLTPFSRTARTAERRRRPVTLRRATSLDEAPALTGAAEPVETRVEGNVDDEPSVPSVPPTSVREGMTLVLAVRINDNELPRALALVASVLKFAEPGAVARLLVVVPDREKELFELAANALTRYASGTPAFSIDVVGDTAVVPTTAAELATLAPATSAREHENRGGRSIGYRIQMLAKLGASRLIDTAHYVTLDADVLLTRPLAAEDLLDDGGRALAMRDPANQRPGWFECARTVLQAPPECVSTAYGGVTPAVLETRTARELLDGIENTHRESWERALFRQLDSGCDWTEYALYWTWACKAGVLQARHSFTNALYDPRDFQWNAYKSWDFARVFGGGGGGSGGGRPVFKVAQGIGGSFPSEILRAIAPHLA